MNKRKLLMVVLAVVIAGGSFAASRSSKKHADNNEQKTTRILVAARDLNPGDTLDAKMLSWQAWPADAVNQNFYVEKTNKEGAKVSADIPLGLVVRSAISAGSPLLHGDLVKGSDRGFLAAVMSKGMRAVTVPVNKVTGIGGFIFPGDRVDVIMTHSLKREDDVSMQERRASETIVENVKVLAVDQRTASSPEPEAGVDKSGGSKAKPGETVTLEVTPRQAESLALAKEIGKLSLSLCSLAGQENIKTESTELRPRKQNEGTASEHEEKENINKATENQPTLAASNPHVPKEDNKASTQNEKPVSHAEEGNSRVITWDSDVSVALPKPTDKAEVNRTVKIIRPDKNAEELDFKRQ
ncbi:MAG: Flp pilus assembly protein CpaB [Alphaproteobacteria bacterium]